MDDGMSKWRVAGRALLILGVAQILLGFWFWLVLISEGLSTAWIFLYTIATGVLLVALGTYVRKARSGAAKAALVFLFLDALLNVVLILTYPLGAQQGFFRLFACAVLLFLVGRALREGEPAPAIPIAKQRHPL
jgi:hypothetical protein